MKVAIPVLDKNMHRNHIAVGLSVTGYLCIYDVTTNEGTWMRTLDLAPNMGELLPALEQQSVSAIITEQIHPMALKVLVNSGFKVYRSNGNVLEFNIDLFKMKTLIPFDMDAAMDFATVCGGTCESCKTECEEK